MFDPLYAQLRGQSQQQTYFTPQQYSTIFRQMTAPGVAGLEEQFGQQMQRGASNFASRGQLFGGSLTGLQAQLGAGQGRALSDLFSNVGGQLGLRDIELGAQQRSQSEALMAQIMQAILGGQLQLGQLARRG
jgi:hypothetical protein